MPCNCRQLGNTHEHISRPGNGSPSTAAQHLSLNSYLDLSKAAFYNIQQHRTDALKVLDPAVLNNSSSNSSAAASSVGIVSDADEEILITVQFTDFVRIKGINIVGPSLSPSATAASDAAQCPAALKLFANRGPDVTGFDSVRRLAPDQALHLTNGSGDQGALDVNDLLYLLDPHKFSNVSTLALLIDANYGADETSVLRIEFFGETTGQQVDKALASNLVFEARANPADHPECVDQTRRAHVL